MDSEEGGSKRPSCRVPPPRDRPACPAAAPRSSRAAAAMSCGRQGNAGAVCEHPRNASCAGRCRCGQSRSRPRGARGSNQALPPSRPAWQRSPRGTATNSNSSARTATGPAGRSIRTGYLFSRLPECRIRPAPPGRRNVLARAAVNHLRPGEINPGNRQRRHAGGGIREAAGKQPFRKLSERTSC